MKMRTQGSVCALLSVYQSFKTWLGMWNALLQNTKSVLRLRKKENSEEQTKVD